MKLSAFGKVCIAGIVVVVVVVGFVLMSGSQAPKKLPPELQAQYEVRMAEKARLQEEAAQRRKNDRTLPVAPAPVKPPVIADKLLLISWSWKEEHGYAKVEGEVQNLTSGNLKNVEAVAKFYASSGEFITAEDCLIEYNPIMSGQISPFKVTVKHNPAMEAVIVEFKELRGGTIPFKTAEKTN